MAAPRALGWAGIALAVGPLLVPIGAARAGGFPPIAVASASTDEVVVGAEVQFSSDGSVDPDMSPGPLTLTWSFGDGASSAEPDPVHVFAAPGAYRVTLVASDGESTTETGLTVYVLAPAASPGPEWSAPLVLVQDGAEVWVASADDGSIGVVGTEELALRDRIAVCGEPVALSSSAGRVLVACAGSGDVVAVDIATRAIVSRSARLSTRVAGIVGLGAGGVAVTLPDEGAVALLDADLQLADRLDVGGTPRAIARDGAASVVWVASFLSSSRAGQVSAIDLASGRIEHVQLAFDPGPDTPSSSRGVPNLLGAIAIEPAADTLWIGGLKSNVARGLFRDGEPLTHDSRVRGMMTPVDLGARAEVLDRRIDTNDADAVSAIAFSPAGRFAYVAHPGLGALSTYDLAALRLFSPGRGATVPFRSRVEIGDLPDGIVVSRDGSRAYVRAALSRALVALDLSDAAVPSVLARIEIAPETLDPRIALGRVLFHRSAAPVHSRSGYVACASCHPDGGHDGQTWDFTHAGEGLRNTTDLRGHGGTMTGPLHWSANFDEVQDFENDIVHQFGGTGLAADGAPPNAPLAAPNAGRSEALDALAAYVESLRRVPASPFRPVDGAPSESGRRGRAVFERAGCPACHAAPLYTDSSVEPRSALHDVGTIGDGSGMRLGAGPLTGLDTPTLLGVWASAPYFHDGSAATIDDVVARDLGDMHGTTSTLSSQERADLVRYLLELDRADEPVSLPTGCGCRAASPRTSRGVTGVLLALLGAIGARRRSV